MLKRKGLKINNYIVEKLIICNYYGLAIKYIDELDSISDELIESIIYSERTYFFTDKVLSIMDIEKAYNKSIELEIGNMEEYLSKITSDQV